MVACVARASIAVGAVSSGLMRRLIVFGAWSNLRRVREVAPGTSENVTLCCLMRPIVFATAIEGRTPACV